ncbi:MAG: NifU N-terminal domain-containing protein [Bacteroidota bacterium]
MTIRTRPTPNPNSLRFDVEGVTLTEARQLAFHSSREAESHALASALFRIRGVESLLIIENWLTVTKHPAADWDLITTGVEATLRDELEGESRET